MALRAMEQDLKSTLKSSIFCPDDGGRYNIHKPMGVSEYELTRALPNELKSALPTIEQIEAELQQSDEYEE